PGQHITQQHIGGDQNHQHQHGGTGHPTCGPHHGLQALHYKTVQQPIHQQGSHSIMKAFSLTAAQDSCLPRKSMKASCTLRVVLSALARLSRVSAVTSFNFATTSAGNGRASTPSLVTRS